MANSKEILDELLKDHKGPDDITGPDGLLKQLTKAVIERAMPAEKTEQLGFEKTIPRPNQPVIEGTVHRKDPSLGPGSHRYRGAAGSGRRVQASHRPQTAARV